LNSQAQLTATSPLINKVIISPFMFQAFG
jgi:hypothetical protein